MLGTGMKEEITLSFDEKYEHAGSWNGLFAPFRMYHIKIEADNPGLFDVAVGLAGNENGIYENVLAHKEQPKLPLGVEKGNRFAIRKADNNPYHGDVIITMYGHIR